MVNIHEHKEYQQEHGIYIISTLLIGKMVSCDRMKMDRLAFINAFVF